ncbi:MAG: hypothetical protein AAB691_00490 [Patescibacteria group bacterium]
MTTKYYCKNCDSSFSEAKLPNLNKVHHCGELARVTDFLEEESVSEQQGSH